MRNVAAPAPAKINLSLEVLGRRPDGYHELRSVMQTLSLADTVTLRETGGPAIEVGGPFAPGTPCDESNLVLRALRAAEMSWPAISLSKRIPPAGGLGGGASDAATALRLLQRIGGAIDDSRILAAANGIGSDEAFFLAGGTALVTGRGDTVLPLPTLAPHSVVLFVPPSTIETKTSSLFAALAERGAYDTGQATAGLLAMLEGQLTCADVHNTFEQVAFDVFPGLAELRDEISRAIGEMPRLAGAGPTLFWIGRTDDSERIAIDARGLGCTVINTTTADSLWRR